MGGRLLNQPPIEVEWDYVLSYFLLQRRRAKLGFLDVADACIDCHSYCVIAVNVLLLRVGFQVAK